MNKKIKTKYTKQFILDTINKIAIENNIKITFEGNINHNINKAFCGGNEIIFSTFNNIEYLFIAFFHEYAHLRLKNNIPGYVEGYEWNRTSSMQWEIQVTMADLNYAQELGIVFSDEAVKWLLKGNFTYGQKPNDIYGILKIKHNKDLYELNQCFNVDKYLKENE